MDGSAGVERVVEVERMAHAGVQQRGLRRRQAGWAQEHAAFLKPAPSAHHPTELVNPRGAAATEHAAKGIENVAAGGSNGALGQVGIVGAADVLDEWPSGVIGHCFSPIFPCRLMGEGSRGQPGDNAYSMSASICSVFSVAQLLHNGFIAHRNRQSRWIKWM